MALFEEIFTLKDLRNVVNDLSEAALDRMKEQLSLQFQLEYGLLDEILLCCHFEKFRVFRTFCFISSSFG